jgi:hypothetical protein
MRRLIVIAFACLVVIGSGAFGAPSAQSTVDQKSAAQSTAQQKKQVKKNVGPGHEAANGGEDVAKGVGRGTESMAKGTAGSVGNLATGHPVMAASSLGKGAAGLGKDSGKGAVKGTAKAGKGLGGGIKKLGRKIF